MSNDVKSFTQIVGTTGCGKTVKLLSNLISTVDLHGSHVIADTKLSDGKEIPIKKIVFYHTESIFSLTEKIERFNLVPNISRDDDNRDVYDEINAYFESQCVEVEFVLLPSVKSFNLLKQIKPCHHVFMDVSDYLTEADFVYSGLCDTITKCYEKGMSVDITLQSVIAGKK